MQHEFSVSNFFTIYSCFGIKVYTSPATSVIWDLQYLKMCDGWTCFGILHNNSVGVCKRVIA